MLKQFKSSVLLVWLSTDIVFYKTEFRLVCEEPIGNSGWSVDLHIRGAYCQTQDLGNGVNITYYNHFERMKIWTWRSTKEKSEVSLLTDFVTGFPFFFWTNRTSGVKCCPSCQNLVYNETRFMKLEIS